MISHEKAKALISARYDELLSQADTRAVQEHLASCAACRQFAAETELLVNGLRTLPQLPPSPRVSRAVREGMRVGGSPWGWLGRGLQIATSPALAVASSLVLVAALAFIIVLALRPLGIDEQPRATISALADVIETPTTEPERTPITAPTVAPTEPAVAAPTQIPTAEPTARLTNVVPPTNTPSPTPAAEPTVAPTERPIVTREQTTEPPVVETPEPTVAPPVTVEPTQPAPASVPETAPEPTTMIEVANEAVAPEPTSPPIQPASEGAPFTAENPVTVDENSDQPPAYEQPIIEQGGPETVVEPSVEGAPATVDTAAIMTGPADETPAAIEDAAPQAAATEAAPTAPPAPTSTPVQIVTAESTLPPLPESGPAPQLERRTGNEAVSMSGDSMVAEIQATVQAGLADDSGPPTFPPEPTPTPAPAGQELVTPASDPAVIQPTGAEITGAPISEPVTTEAESGQGYEAGTEAGAAEANPAPISAGDPAASQPVAGDVPVVDEAPVQGDVPVVPQIVGAPEPQWPGIAGTGTQMLSNTGYSAVLEGGGVTVVSPDGTPLGWVGGGVPIWSPSGTSLLVIGGDGLGAVWDANVGTVGVERPSAAARDVPVGWYNGEPLVQRLYLDGSGVVELRVAPVGGGGYAIWTGTADSVFGEGVTAARLSPDGGQLSFYSGGQFYVAPVGDPASAVPAG